MEVIIALVIVIVSLSASLADLTAPAYFETSPPAVETPPLAPLETFHSTAHYPHLVPRFQTGSDHAAPGHPGSRTAQGAAVDGAYPYLLSCG